MILQIATLLASLVILVTVIAQLNDHPRSPSTDNLCGLVRHHANKFGLVLLGAGACMTGLLALTGQPIKLEIVALLLGVATRQVTHPDSWWEFVIHGRGHQASRL